jgi:type IV secretion system protein TrbL
MRANKSVVLVGAILLLCSLNVSAELSYHDAATNDGVLDQVVTAFSTRAVAWQSVVMSAASWLFWTLGSISFTWTMGMLALRKADIGDFFAEFIRFTLFFGFFYWLLQNGPDFADSIIRSLRQIGDHASGTTGLSPSGIVDIGFIIWKQAISNLSAWNPVDSFVGMVLSAGILLLLAVIAVNMLLLQVTAWILMYAGIFFLGFGGSRWTSDMAINYFKTVLGIAIQLFVMILLVGIGIDLLSSFYAKMSKATLNFEELGVMLVFCIALLLLVARVPSLVAGVVTGGSGGGGGIGSYGAGAIAGAALGAAGTAASAASMAGAAVMGGAQNIAGGASAIMAAVQKAQGGMDSGGTSSMSGASGKDSSASSSPFSAAMGLSTSGSSSGGIQNAARLAVSATSELAKGIGAVVKDKATQAADNFSEKAGETLGGQVATAIRGQDFAEDNSLGGIERPAEDIDEVAAFANRD